MFYLLSIQIDLSDLAATQNLWEKRDPKKTGGVTNEIRSLAHAEVWVAGGRPDHRRAARPRGRRIGVHDDRRRSARADRLGAVLRRSPARVRGHLVRAARRGALDASLEGPRARQQPGQPDDQADDRSRSLRRG